MIDASVKLAVAAAIAWLMTRRVPPALASAAHRTWAVVVLSPLLWLGAEAFFSPAVFVRPAAGTASADLAGRLDALWPLIAAVYLLGATVLLLRILFGVVAVNSLIARARRVPASELRARMPEFPESVDVREAAVSVPVTAGFVRPVIVLPAGWRNFKVRGLTAILRHEAAHVRRRDSLMTFACAVFEALFWFHPAMWFAGARVRWFAELACDAEAARGMATGEYASELLALAAEWRDAKRSSYAITAGAASGVGRRIAVLIDDLERSRPRRRLLPVAALLIVTLLMLGSAVRVDTNVRPSSPFLGDWDHETLHRIRHAHPPGH